MERRIQTSVTTYMQSYVKTFLPHVLSSTSLIFVLFVALSDYRHYGQPRFMASCLILLECQISP